MNLFEFIEAIKKWREERGITIDQGRLGFAKNMFEELAEFFEAGDLEGEIDALIDMMVFTINTFEDTSKISKDYYVDFNTNANMGNVVKYINYYIKSDFKDVSDFINLINELLSLIPEDYDISICLSEVVKELNSRTGAWSEEHKKWIKDTSPEAKAKWYKADFTMAYKREGVLDA